MAPVLAKGHLERLCQEERPAQESRTSGRRRSVGRDFSGESSNALWLTDITEHRMDEGKLYCCAVKDVYSNLIVAYSLSDRMTVALAVSALRNAMALRHPVGTMLIHSDRGRHLVPRPSSRVLKHNELTGSVARVGACGDNAAMVSLFIFAAEGRLGSSAL